MDPTNLVKHRGEFREAARAARRAYLMFKAVLPAHYILTLMEYGYQQPCFSLSTAESPWLESWLSPQLCCSLQTPRGRPVTTQQQQIHELHGATERNQNVPEVSPHQCSSCSNVRRHKWIRMTFVKNRHKPTNLLGRETNYGKQLFLFIRWNPNSTDLPWHYCYAEFSGWKIIMLTKRQLVSILRYMLETKLFVETSHVFLMFCVKPYQEHAS